MEVTIHDLPNEILMEVFFRLPASAVPRCASVCKRWNSVASEEHLWKLLYTSHYNPVIIPEGFTWKRQFLEALSLPRAVTYTQHLSDSGKHAWACAWSPDGQILAAADNREGGCVHIYEFRRRRSRPRHLRSVALFKPVLSLDFHPTQPFILVSTDVPDMLIVKYDTGEQFGNFSDLATSYVLAGHPRWYNEDRVIVVMCHSGVNAVEVYDILHGKRKPLFSFPCEVDADHVGITRDRRTLFWRSSRQSDATEDTNAVSEGTLEFVNLSTRERNSMSLGSEFAIALDVCPNDKQLLACTVTRSSNHAVDYTNAVMNYHVIDIASRSTTLTFPSQLFQQSSPHLELRVGLGGSRGEYAAIGNPDGTSIYHIPTGSLVAQIPDRTFNHCAAWHPLFRNVLAVVNEAGQVKLVQTALSQKQS